MMARTVVTSRLPSRWPKFPGLLEQGNLSVGHGRLRAKLLIFDRPESMRKFWKKRLGFDLGPRCLGAVNSLRSTVSHVAKDGSERVLRIEVDARYFCVIGLCRKHLTMRIISHECVHGGFAFARRRTRSPWGALALEFDEEGVAYPAGELARSTCVFLQRVGFYDD